MIKYEDMLRNEIVPAIQAIMRNIFKDTWFQQDDAAPHYKRNIYYDVQIGYAQRTMAGLER